VKNGVDYMIEHMNKGTCSTKVQFDLLDGKVHNVSFENGCNGNLKAIGVLTEGMEAIDVVQRLKGLKCMSEKGGRGQTSCGDQFAQALEEALVSN
jgi:uncharacterized protein (TIGR03905 family)